MMSMSVFVDIYICIYTNYLYYILLYYINLQYIILYYIISYYIISYYILFYHIIVLVTCKEIASTTILLIQSSNQIGTLHQPPPKNEETQRSTSNVTRHLCQQEHGLCFPRSIFNLLEQGEGLKISTRHGFTRGYVSGNQKRMGWSHLSGFASNIQQVNQRETLYQSVL